MTSFFDIASITLVNIGDLQRITVMAERGRVSSQDRGVRVGRVRGNSGGRGTRGGRGYGEGTAVVGAAMPSLAHPDSAIHLTKLQRRSRAEGEVNTQEVAAEVAMEDGVVLILLPVSPTTCKPWPSPASHPRYHYCNLN